MGYLFVIIASVLFGTVPSVQEYVIRQGASPLGLVILCNSAASAAALMLAILRKESLRVSGKALLSLFLAGGIGLFLTDLLLNLAYARIPVGLTIMIHFLYPTIVSIAMMLVFGERFHFLKLGAILLSFGGLFCLFGGSLSADRSGMLAALASAFCYAFYVVSNDRLTRTETPVMVCAFYINLSSVVVALGLNAFAKTAAIPVSPAPFFLGITAGLMLCAGLILLAAGIKRLGASKSAFLNMLEPITSLILSSILEKTFPGWLTLVGSVLIVFSLTLYALCGRKTENR